MAQTENFNRENVLKALADIVDEYGTDFRYRDPGTARNCMYSENGEPSCLVGHVLARVAPGTFKQIAEWEDECGESCSVLDLGDNDVAGVPLNADSERETLLLIDALYYAQCAQDIGNTWGEAENAARAVLGESPRA